MTIEEYVSSLPRQNWVMGGEYPTTQVLVDVIQEVRKRTIDECVRATLQEYNTEGAREAIERVVNVEEIGEQ